MYTKYNQPSKTVKHFPSSVREWDNNIYTYNINALKLIPYTTLLVNEMVKTYFNMYSYEIKKKIVLRYKYKKLSSEKIYISGGEYKHTNNKITINIYTFNRENCNYNIILNRLFKFFFKETSIKKVYNKGNKQQVKPENNLIIKPKNNGFIRSVVLLFLNDKKQCNSLVPLFSNKTTQQTESNPIKLDVFFYKKIKQIKKKALTLLKLIKKEKNLILINLLLGTETKNNIYINISSYIINFYKKFIKNYLKKIKIYVFYRQLIFINKSKYNYNNLQYLTNFLHSIYNKNIEYNFINLKRFYLHSNIISEVSRLKLRNNRTAMLTTLSDIKEKILLKDSSHFNNFSSIIMKQQVNKNYYIIKNLKFKYISGFKLQVKGRLTKRNKAERSVLKTTSKGSLLNIYFSDKRLSTVLLKGNLNSNLQYTKLRAKSRIGSFGIKGWISGK